MDGDEGDMMFYKVGKKIKYMYFMFIFVFGILSFSENMILLQTYAEEYSQEQKDAAKAWLSAHGYPPTRAGAAQAYQDYQNGKFDDEIAANPEAAAALKKKSNSSEASDNKTTKKKKKKHKQDANSEKNLTRRNHSTEAAKENTADSEEKSSLQTENPMKNTETTVNTAEDSTEITKEEERELLDLQTEDKEVSNENLVKKECIIFAIILVFGLFLVYIYKNKKKEK